LIQKKIKYFSIAKKFLSFPVKSKQKPIKIAEKKSNKKDNHLKFKRSYVLVVTEEDELTTVVVTRLDCDLAGLKFAAC
jgi:hypothetical protein